MFLWSQCGSLLAGNKSVNMTTLRRFDRNVWIKYRCLAVTQTVTTVKTAIMIGARVFFHFLFKENSFSSVNVCVVSPSKCEMVHTKHVKRDSIKTDMYHLFFFQLIRSRSKCFRKLACYAHFLLRTLCVYDILPSYGFFWFSFITRSL